MKDQGKIIAALLVGAAAGAVISLLFAPESGTELRDDIADYVNDVVEKSKNKAQRTVDDVKEYGNNVVERARTRFNGVRENISDYTNNISGAVRSAADDYTDKANEHGEEIVNEAKAKVKTKANDVNNAIQGI